MDSSVVIARSAAHELQQIMLRRVWKPLPHQIPPTGAWYGWLILAGRGSGKTDACAKYMTDHINGPPCLPGAIPHWTGIIAPTLGDAATAGFFGPSGTRAHDPSAKIVNGLGGTVIRWTNGSECKLFGASTLDDVDRLRAGGNRCLMWLEEVAAWRYLDACWDQMRFGLRAGPRPHWIGSTTPKPRVLIKKLRDNEIPNCDVIVSTASTYDNPHLPEMVRQSLLDAYEGTSLGEQELRARIIEHDENALWTPEGLAENRIRPIDGPPYQKINVNVDPSGGAGEQGIVVIGAWSEMAKPQPDKAPRKVTQGYTLDDRTCHLGPDGWGRRAVQAAIDWEAHNITVEVNYGGAMAVATIRGAAEHMGIDIPVKMVTATRGKRIRAEPVAALTPQRKWHHVGTFPELENQLCVWTPEADYSPDRLDAMVWGAWSNKIVSLLRSAGGSFAGSAVAQTTMK